MRGSRKPLTAWGWLLVIAMGVCEAVISVPLLSPKPAWLYIPPPPPPTPYTVLTWANGTALVEAYVDAFCVQFPCALLEKVELSC